MIDRVLVPLDGSPAAEGTLPHAMALARGFEAELLLLRVLPVDRRALTTPVDSADWRLRRAEAAAYLDGLGQRLLEHGISVSVETLEGNTEEQIIATARARGIDLIVISTHGRSGPNEFNLGGTAAKILARAGISVMVVRSRTELGQGSQDAGDQEYGRVVAAVDCSHLSDWALHLGAALARSNGAELIIVHVVPVPELVHRRPGAPADARLVDKIVRANRAAAEGYLEEMAAQLRSADLAVRTELLAAPHVAQNIDELASRENAGLVVLAAHGASGASRWPYGSVAGSLLAYGNTPVLIFQDLARKPTENGRRESSLTARTGPVWSR